MPESVSGVDEILAGLRGAAANDFIHQKPYVPFADAESAVREARDATIREIVEGLERDPEFLRLVQCAAAGDDPAAVARAVLARIASRFPVGGGS